MKPFPRRFNLAVTLSGYLPVTMRGTRSSFWLLSVSSIGLMLGASGASAAAPDAATTLGREMQMKDPARKPKDKIAPPIVESRASVDVATTSAVMVGAVQIEGLEVLSPTLFADVIDQFIGQELDSAGLERLARAVADRARAEGFVFASAMIPPQSIRMGVVRVRVDEGRVDEVRIEGAHGKRLGRLLRSMAGRAISKQELERILLTAADLPGVSIGQTRFERAGGHGILHVEVSRDTAQGKLEIDNSGSASVGKVRARLSLDMSDLLGEGDNLSVTAVSSPLDPKELAFVSTQYERRIGDSGLSASVTAAAGRTRPDPDLSVIDTKGHSHYLAGQVSYPVIRSMKANVSVAAEIAYLSVAQDLMGIATTRDDIVTLTVSAWGNMRLTSGQLAAGVSVSQGLDIFGATKPGDFLTSRFDASGQFTKFSGWAFWKTNLDRQTTLKVSLVSQLSSAPLLAAQEISIGGPQFGRAYNFSQRFGDEGVIGSIELRRRYEGLLPGLDWVQAYGFADGGYVTNKAGGFGGGSLYSVGSGLRIGKGRAELGIEAAYPLNADPTHGDSKDPRINLSVSLGL